MRVLDPSDPWLEPSRSDRAANFRGNPEWHISVAMEARCSPLTVLAALHGARRGVAVVHPAYYRFTDREVFDVGGRLEDTPANPPWPPDYNHAHHDVVAAQDTVAVRMADLHTAHPGRVSWVLELDVLREIAGLLGRQGVHPKYEKNATHRFRRMFEDGGNERRLWIQVAREHPVLLDPVGRDLRKMYQDKTRRVEWTALMDEVGVAEQERERYR